MMFSSLVAATLVCANPASAADAGAPAPALTKKNWKQHPRIVAIRAQVDAIDTRAVSGEGFRQCGVRLANHAPPRKGEPLLLRVWVMQVDEDDADGDRPLRRRKLRFQSIDHTGPDFPLENDYTVTQYLDDERPLFQFIKGTDRGVGFFAREIRTYFAEDGKPFWSIGATRGAQGGSFNEAVTRHGEITARDFREYDFPAGLQDDPVRLLVPGGFEVSTSLKPCTEAEAARLLALAEAAVDAPADQAFARRFLPSPKRRR